MLNFYTFQRFIPKIVVEKPKSWFDLSSFYTTGWKWQCSTCFWIM